MGSFVAELTPAAYAALVAARDMPRAELHAADEEETVRRGAPPPRLGAATEPKDRSAGAADAEPGTATKQAPTGATPPKADAPEDAAGREKGLAKGSETGTPKGAEPAPAGGAPRDAKAKLGRAHRRRHGRTTGCGTARDAGRAAGGRGRFAGGRVRGGPPRAHRRAPALIAGGIAGPVVA
jgi:hypothetical protein